MADKSFFFRKPALRFLHIGRLCKREAGDLRRLIIDAAIRWPLARRTEDAVLIVRVDAIGDYMLFRQCLRALRFAPRFQGKKIVLCGNALWRSLAEALDGDAFDEFIPVQRERFMKDAAYRSDCMIAVRERGFTQAIQPTFSRDYVGDSLMRASGAAERIGFACPAQNLSLLARSFFNRCYSELIAPKPGFPFELERNAEILAYLDVPRADIPAFLSVPPNIATSPTVASMKGAPVFFLGASQQWKRWPAKFFAELVAPVFARHNAPILLLGGMAAEKEMAHVASRHPKKVLPLPETTLPEMAMLIAEAPLLISNDSAAAHMGATYGTPTVIISNGQSKGRFHPYPESLAPHVRVVYPEPVARDDFLCYYTPSRYPITQVAPAAVLRAVERLLPVTQKDEKIAVRLR